MAKKLKPVDYLRALNDVRDCLTARGVTNLFLSRYELDRLNDAAETGLAIGNVADWIIATRAEPRFAAPPVLPGMDERDVAGDETIHPSQAA